MTMSSAYQVPRADDDEEEGGKPDDSGAAIAAMMAVLTLTGPFVQPALGVVRACTSNTTAVHRWLERNGRVTAVLEKR